MAQRKTNIRILVRPSVVEGLWVAVCIDHYMVGEGPTADAALKGLFRVFAAELELAKERGTALALEPAPQRYHDAYEEARYRPRAGKPSTTAQEELNLLWELLSTRLGDASRHTQIGKVEERLDTVAAVV